MRDLGSNELSRLSPEERLALIGQLWDSLRDTDVPLPESQQDELARQLSSLEQDRTEAVHVRGPAFRGGSATVYK
jgi:putative addiction module component (TIGR02574 family)